MMPCPTSTHCTASSIAVTSRMRLSADAVSMRLAAAIDALRTPDGSLEDRLFGEDWQFMWAMRNRLTHGYITVDLRIVEATISGDLPDFERTLRAELDNLG